MVSFLSLFVYINMGSICQDRLGTNIANALETEENTRFLAAARAGAIPQPWQSSTARAFPVGLRSADERGDRGGKRDGADRGCDA
jgi:hypothetical protein